jgi:6-phosphogluconolactonase
MSTQLPEATVTSASFLVASLLSCVAAAQDLARDPAQQAAVGPLTVYVGTYTHGASQGIYLCRLDLGTGALTSPELAAEVQNPSFVAIHPSRHFLYAAGELGDFRGKQAGAVSAFAIDPATGRLKLLNQQPSGGGGPCHLVVDAAGKNVLVANYGGGSVAVLPLQKDGRLSEPSCVIQHQGSGPDRQRQQGPHAHSINLDAANHFAFAADLGLDKVLIYRFDANQGTLAPNEPPLAAVAPGAGPRHFAFHPSGKFAYVINEMHSTVTAFAYDRDAGKLQSLQTITTLPADFRGSNTTAEVQVHPSGKFLYGSNRGHHSLAVFAIDQATGKLTSVEQQSTQGKTPRNFGIDPTGKFLLAANMDSNTIVVFRIDPATGVLTPAGHQIDVPIPVCVKMLQLP